MDIQKEHWLLNVIKPSKRPEQPNENDCSTLTNDATDVFQWQA